jgi:transposase
MPSRSLVATSLTLSELDRSRVQTFVHRGHAGARARTRAQVLLKLGEGWSDAAVGEAFGVCRNTIQRVRARFAQAGVDAVLTDQAQERRRQALSGEQQAHVIALACSAVPEGHDHWTLRMLASKVVELGFVARISPETIRHTLKKTHSSRGSTTSGASPR